jgi:fructose-bisphosphate aldolase class 1
MSDHDLINKIIELLDELLERWSKKDFSFSRFLKIRAAREFKVRLMEG